MSTEPTYPMNAEHHEARQAEINQKKDDIRKMLPPAECHRLEVIEDCAKRLEEAQVPFLLWASTQDKEPEGRPVGWREWWQFNKMTYAPLEPFDTHKEQTYYACQSLLGGLLKHQSLCVYGAIVVYHDDGKFRLGFKQGQSFVLQDPV